MTSPRHFPAGTTEEFIAHKDSSPLSKIAPIVQQSIAEGAYPGAVILASRANEIVYRGVFGSQSLIPVQTPMHVDTIFDVASLTKVVVTATAIMQLVEANKLALDDTIAAHWPEFAANEKADITVRDCLTHTSGLAATIPSLQLNEILPENLRVPDLFAWSGEDEGLHKVINTKPLNRRQSSFLYSDINFIALGHIIKLISGMTLNKYAQEKILQPLGMRHSSFLPAKELMSHIAPTEIISEELLWGEAHDPTTHLMGGVAGMAGLFSTATDLGIFAQCILNKGKTTSSKQILKPESVAMMTSVQTPKNIPEKRGLGWDIQSPLSCRGNFSASSFGHTGWTGVSMWIDPEINAWLVILTSRTHPTPASENKLPALRKTIATLVADHMHSKQLVC